MGGRFVPRVIAAALIALGLAAIGHGRTSGTIGPARARMVASS